VLDAPSDFWIASFPQWLWFADARGESLIVPPENVGYVEQIARDASHLLPLGDNDAPKPIPHLNKSRHRPWRAYYKNPFVRARVFEIFQRDFELFGYSKTLRGPSTFRPSFEPATPFK
jgi:hypothetical protein